MAGLLSALGAGVLLTDRYLAPLLAGTLLLTLLIAGLHWRRHQQPGPFALSLVAAASVFFAIYGVGLLPQTSGGDHMADGMAGPPPWSPFLAFGAILVLLGVQVSRSLALPSVRAEDHVGFPARPCRLLGNTKGACLMRRLGGAVLAVTGVLACPCHLVVTLPLLAGLLAGTALGHVLTHNTSSVYTRAGIYFVGVLALGYWFWFSPARGKREVREMPAVLKFRTESPAYQWLNTTLARWEGTFDMDTGVHTYQAYYARA